MHHIVCTDTNTVIAAENAVVVADVPTGVSQQVIIDHAQERGYKLDYAMERVVDSLLATWRSRCASMQFTPEERLDKQCEFFCGAMAALVAMGLPHGKAMPPVFVIHAMTGRDLSTVNRAVATVES